LYSEPVGYFVDIPKPKAWPPPKDSCDIQKLVSYGYERDPIGDKVHTWFACLFLFCLPLATGPASISMAILFVYSLLRLPTTWRTLTPILNSRVYWSVLAWALYSTISIAWSSDRTMGWDHANSMWLMAVPIPVLLWPILRKWKLLIAMGLAGVFLQNLFQLSEFVGSWFLDGNDWISIVKNRFREDAIEVYFARPIGLDNHEGNGSLFIATSLLVWLGLLVGKRRSILLIFLPLSGAIFGLIAAYSRAALVGFGVAVVVFTAISIKNRIVSPRSAVLTLLSLLIICVAAAFVIPSQYFGRIIEIPRATIEYFEHGTVNTGVDERLNWYSTEFKKSFEEPIFKNVLIGHGLGSTSEIDFSIEGQPVQATTVHPHNAFAQILFEGGFVGLCLFSLMLFRIAISSQTNRDVVVRITGLSCIILWSITAFFDGGQNSGRVLALLMVLLVVYEFIKQFQEQACTPPTGQP
jgi:hypothetical protein